jgi:6-phosphogluconolactonase (cycloisomerase 2 family)
LTPVAGSPFVTGTTPTPQAPSTAAPVGITVSSNNFVYVANQGQNSISAYSLNTGSGALTPLPGSPFVLTSTAPTGILAVQTANSVRVLYLTNEGSNNLSGFLINTDGSLIEVAGSPFSAQLGPVALAVDTTKNFLYAAEMNSNEISQYRINPGSGSLSALSPAAVSTGTSPVSIAIHPNGLYLYTANVGSDSINGFRISVQSGTLSPIQTATTSSRPAGLAVK